MGLLTLSGTSLRKWLNKLSSPVSRIQHKCDGDATHVAGTGREEAGCWESTFRTERLKCPGAKINYSEKGNWRYVTGPKCYRIGELRKPACLGMARSRRRRGCGGCSELFHAVRSTRPGKESSQQEALTPWCVEAGLASVQVTGVGMCVWRASAAPVIPDSLYS